MQVESGFDDFSDDECRDVLRQSLPLLDVLVEIVAVDVLGDDVDVRLAADGLLVLHYLRMRNDLHDLALVVESGDRLRVQLLSPDVLQRKAAARLLGSAPVDDGEFASADHLVGVVEVVQGVALVLLELLEVAVGLGLRLEVEHEFRVELVAVTDLDSQAFLVAHFLHLQPLQADHPHRRPAVPVGIGQDEQVLDKHAVDWFGGSVGGDSCVEGGGDSGEVSGLRVEGAPDVDVEAGVVAFEEFAVAADPLLELREGEAAWEGWYKPVFVSIW